MSIPSYAKKIKLSNRGELEITDLNKIYLEKEQLRVERMSRGYSWLIQAHTKASLRQLARATIERRQGIKIASPEEIAFRKGWINETALVALATHAQEQHGQYLCK